MDFKKRKTKRANPANDLEAVLNADLDLTNLDPTKISSEAVQEVAVPPHNYKKVRNNHKDDKSAQTLVSLNMNIESIFEQAIPSKTISNDDITTFDTLVQAKCPADGDGHDNDDKLKKPSKFSTSGQVQVQTTIDYAPDICKDYKLYGYCGWGDSCKFIHDRSAIKSNAQMDSEWARYQAKKANANRRPQEDNENTSNPPHIPKFCEICGKDLPKKSIVTLCRHYFCSTCAFQRFTVDKTCLKCGVETKGRFTPFDPTTEQ